MRRMSKKGIKIIVLAIILLTATITIVATSNQNTATSTYFTFLLNQNTSPSYPDIQTSPKDFSSIISAGNEYYVPFIHNISHGSNFGSSLFIYSPIDTTIRIDSDNDDVFENVLSITANNETVYLFPVVGTHIVSDDPVFIHYRYHTNDFSVYDDQDFAYTLLPVSTLGTDYYLPSNPTIISIAATKDSTNIQIDTNNDGTPEATHSNLDSGTVINYTNPLAGTHITSNTPIFVVAVNYNWANKDSTYSYPVLPTERLGTEYWFHIDYKNLPFNVVNDYTGMHIVAIQDNTQLYANSINYALNAGESLIHSFNKGSINITSDKPVGVAYILDAYATDPWDGNRHYMHALSLIPISQLGNEYPISYYVVATHDNTRVYIDGDFDGNFEYVNNLNIGEAINTFTSGSLPSGATGLITGTTGYIRSNQPVLSYLSFTRLWGGTGLYTWINTVLPFQPKITVELGVGQNQQVNATTQLGVELSLNLSKPVLLNMTQISISDAGDAPNGLDFIGRLVSMVVNDTTAVQGINITMHYTDWEVARLRINETSFSIWYWNETSGNWFNLSSIVDTENNTITTHTDHLTYNLTYFAVLGTPSPPAWLSGWVYRKSHTIIGSTAGAQTNYQMKITINHGYGTDSGEDVYCNFQCREDFGDIRFTKSDGTTLLDYWMEEKNDGDNATFWVEIDSIPASPNTVDIYIYFGRDDANTTSNGYNTFVFFDDFNSLDTNIWDETELIDDAYVGWTIEDGNLVLYVGTRGKSKVWNGGQKINTKDYYDLENKTYEIRTTMTMGGTLYDANNYRTKAAGIGIWLLTNGEAEERLYGRHEGTDHWLRYSEIAGTSSQVLWSTTTWDGAETDYYVLGLRRDGNEIKLYENQTLITTYTDSLTTGDVKLGIITQVGWYSANGWGEQSIDWARIRNYADPEPTHGSWGSEEQRVITIELGAGLNQQINLSAEFGVEFSLNLTNPVLLNITRPTGSGGGVAPPGLAFLGIFVSIEVNDTTAIEGITIIIHYTDQQIAELGLDESSLAMWYWNVSSGNWVLLPSTVDVGNNIVFAHTDHLTYFAVMGTPLGPPTPPYLMFMLLFQLTQSELSPLIFLALGLVLVAVLAVMGVIILKSREETAPEITAPTPIAGVNKCPYCGGEILESANFCIYCGRTLPKR